MNIKPLLIALAVSITLTACDKIDEMKQNLIEGKPAPSLIDTPQDKKESKEVSNEISKIEQHILDRNKS